MSRADVAVIIPVYNRHVSVVEALDSVASQSLPPEQVIVVDDGSTDATTSAVRDWIDQASGDLETLLVQQKNRGAPAARNHGFAEARPTRYVAFLDSDDPWPQDFRSRTTARLAANPQAMAVTSDQFYRNEKTGDTRLRRTSGLRQSATRWIFANDGGIGSCTLFSASVIRMLRGYEEHLPTGQDTELFLRASLHGEWLHVSGKPVVYRQGIDESRGEEQHLSSKYLDRWRRWAEIYERFIVDLGGDQVLPRSFYGPHLGRWWYRAGREMLRCGQTDEARHCLRRAISWHPIYHKSWLRLTQAYLPRAA